MYKPQDILNSEFESDENYTSSSESESDFYKEKSKLASSRKKKIILEEQMINKTKINPKPVVTKRPGGVQIVHTPKKAYESGSISDYEKYSTTTTMTQPLHSKAFIRPTETIEPIQTEFLDMTRPNKLNPHVSYDIDFVNDQVIENSIKSQEDMLKKQQMILNNPYFIFYSLVIGFIPNSPSISSVKRQFEQVYSSSSILNPNSHISNALTSVNVQSAVQSNFTDATPYQPTGVFIRPSISRTDKKGNEFNMMYQRSLVEDVVSSSLVNGIIRVNPAIMSNLNKAYGVLKTACKWMKNILTPKPLMFSNDCQALFADLVASYITQSEIISPSRYVGKSEKSAIDLKIISIIERFKNRFFVDVDGVIKYNMEQSSTSSSSSYSIYPRCPFYIQ